MKLYAGLTINQPKGYINRLKKANGKTLVFICPEQRKASLWNKISSECKENYDVTDEDTYRIKADGIVVAVLSWIEIIEELRRVSSSVAIEMKSDIDQLAGFCKMMDSSTFIPFTSNDFGSVVAQREERHFQVIDRLFDMLIANNSINAEAKSLRASANRNGYTRYIMINNYSVALLYYRHAWMSNSSKETPFWFYFNDDEWNQSDELKDSLNSVPELERDIVDNKIVIALHPLCDVTLDEVADDMMNQIIYYMRDYLPI